MYNSDIDLWFEMPNLNVGRHYHSSCQFNERFVYIFCGIANKTRKYINSFEVYDHQTKKAWQIIDLNTKQFPDRQGAGAIQKDETNILVFGGFSGKFLKDSFLLNTQTNQLTRTAPCPNETFVFQMPNAYDPATDSIFSCDMQHMMVYKFGSDSKWGAHMSLKS
jgi:hypothetical protein